jgi:hypothetical protein
MPDEGCHTDRAKLADFANDIDSLCRAGQKISRRIVVVQRLDQHRDGLGRRFPGIGEIFAESGAGTWPDWRILLTSSRDCVSSLIAASLPRHPQCTGKKIGTPEIS